MMGLNTGGYMLIETTINIQNKAFLNLCFAAGKVKRPKRFVISWLLRRLADERKLPPVSWSRIRYQARNDDKDWEKPHLFLTPAEYELFLDLKKVYKMSGSFLIAFAITNYIEEFMCDECKCADNYRFENYGLSRRVVNNVVCWVQFWGIPPQLLRPKMPSTIRW
jgi:hypothetical protein